MNLPSFEKLEEAWKSPYETCGSDTAERFSHAHPQAAQAKVEEGGGSHLEVKPPRLHLHEISDNPGPDLAFRGDERRQSRQELLVRQARQIHCPPLSQRRNVAQVSQCLTIVHVDVYTCLFKFYVARRCASVTNGVPAERRRVSEE
jgi:hypothetical protein